MRVFAGPNGSGKSTVIHQIRKNGKPILGHYINADELTRNLMDGEINLEKWEISTSKSELISTLNQSSLISKNFPNGDFQKAFHLDNNSIWVEAKDEIGANIMAQIVAEFIRIKMLEKRQRFSFETVFSHISKVDWMRKAREEGYKVYLYFVSTESPEINKARVVNRVKNGGHYVHPQTIEDRYFRSLDYLYEACQFAYQAYFFDTSPDGVENQISWFAHFERNEEGKAIWDQIDDINNVPQWFIRYYYEKQIPG